MKRNSPHHSTLTFRMVTLLMLPAVVNLGGAVNPAWSAEHRVESLKEAPSPEIAEEIREQLGEGQRILRGASRVVCEIWWVREWPVTVEKPESGLIYPFQPGQLIGVLRFPKKGLDFRKQEIPEGVYTLRYALQPVDGAHVGTSITRDFLLMSPIAEDTKLAAPDAKTLSKRSAAGAGTSHPAMLCLLRPESLETTRIRHLEEPDWWVLGIVGKTIRDSKVDTLQLEVVVVGHAGE